MNNKVSTGLGIWAFTFLGYFTLSDLHKLDFAIFVFLIFIVVPQVIFITNSKKLITRLFMVIFGNFGITFFAGNKSYWDFIFENILQMIIGVTIISTITLISFVVKAFKDLKKNDKVVLDRVNELNFIYQGRIDMILQLIKNLPPKTKQSNNVVADLLTVIGQFSKIEEVNSIVECLDIIEKRLDKLFLEITSQQDVMNNQAIVHLLARLSMDEKNVLSGRIIYNHCANDFNESMNYFPLNALANLYSLSPVKKLKVEIAKISI
jgi:hypothetical protein